MTISFRAVVASVPEARRAVDAIPALEEHSEAAFNVRLLVSELSGTACATPRSSRRTRST